jgi:hypothetical protein
VLVRLDKPPIGKCVVNRPFVVQRHDSQVPTLESVDFAPEPIPVVLLRLRPNRMLENPDAPLLAQVRPLLEHRVIEVVREPVLRHTSRIAQLPPGPACVRRGGNDRRSHHVDVVTAFVSRSFWISGPVVDARYSWNGALCLFRS